MAPVQAPELHVDEEPHVLVDQENKAPTPRAEGDEKRVEPPVEAALAFECDFDDDPTMLYQSLQKRDWGATLILSRENPDEAKTWVSRFEKDGRLRWRLLPLHASIIFNAPEDVVEALLCAFPAGSECKDDQGMLPLHLAFRTGSSEAIVNLLLAAYPQSVDIKDRKGRLPLALAQASKSPNRDAFLRALERGPSYYATAAAASERASVTAEQRAIFDAKIIEMKSRHAFEVGAIETNTLAERDELRERVVKLQAELDKTQETSQVLVDHVNSLEAQLSSRGDTERFLATKIATVDQSLKTVSQQKEELEAVLRSENAVLSSEKVVLEEKLQQVTDLNSSNEVKLEKALATIATMEKEKGKRISHFEDKLKALEVDWAGSKATCAILEAQLKKKVDNEHALAAQVSALAASLANSTADQSDAVESYTERLKAVEGEREELRAQAKTLTRKLAVVAKALDEMTEQQTLIVAQAAKHEETMALAALTQDNLLAGAQRQTKMYEKFKKEQEEAAAMLQRQQEEVEESLGERETLMTAVMSQFDAIGNAQKERQELVEGVTAQRTKLSTLIEKELSVIPKIADDPEEKVVIDMQDMAKRHAVDVKEEDEEEEAEVDAPEDEETLDKPKEEAEGIEVDCEREVDESIPVDAPHDEVKEGEP